MQHVTDRVQLVRETNLRRALAVLRFCRLFVCNDAALMHLAAALKVSKPAITRALDRLAEFELVRRKVDQADRRSVLVQRTPKGAALLRDLRGVVVEADAQSRPMLEAASVRRLAS